MPENHRDNSLQDVVVRVDTSGLSDRGLRRPGNEDHFLIAQIDRSWRTLQTSMPADAFPSSVTDSVTVQIVADGMGGAVGGEVASRTAIGAFVDIVLRTPNLILRLDKQSTQDVLTRMAARFELMKQALEEVVRRDPTLTGMGTTMTLAINFRADLLVAHVGDSRAYLFRKGHLERLTRDQTMVQSLLDRGRSRRKRWPAIPCDTCSSASSAPRGNRSTSNCASSASRTGTWCCCAAMGSRKWSRRRPLPTPSQPRRPRRPPVGSSSTSRSADGGYDNVTAVVNRYRIAPLAG